MFAEIQNKAKISLEEVGIKPSVQRMAILGYLLTHFTHPTVDEIYADLSPSIPTLSKTTVYNTLKLFTQADVVLGLNIDDKNQRFDGNTTPHAHFICNQCGAVEDVFIDNQNIFLLPAVESLSIEQVDISYKGLCAQCKAK